MEGSWSSCRCAWSLVAVLVVVLSLSSIACSQNIVTALPGFSGDLPFKLETGYIGIGELEEVQLFYYFIESEREPSEDPLVLWLAGGPGCSGLSSLLFEIGPITIDVRVWNGSLPSIITNSESWTKVANVLFIDQPVGTGFSYATSQSAYNTSDTKSSEQIYEFLRKWLTFHPRFFPNPLYIAGDGYSGLTVPLVVKKILHGLDEKLQPIVNLQGYVLGNPSTDKFIDENYRIPFAHRVSLISDALFKDARLYCYGDYVNIDVNNSLCVTALQSIKECLVQINLVQILEPQCAFASKRRKDLEWDLRDEEAYMIDYLLEATTLSPSFKLPELWCRSYRYMLSYKWANDDRVRAALNVRKGTVSTWKRCAKSLKNYTKDVNSTVAYHKNFTETGLRALVYSGDHDVSVPYIGTLDWIKSLGMRVSDTWRAWYVEGQVAGYTTRFMSETFQLIYATVKGSGHTAPEYTPKQVLGMVDRFFAHYPI